MIYALKNITNADKSYMQDEQTLEAWIFINYIALHRYYRIYQLLVKNKLNNKYSPIDFLLFLKEIRKVKINDKWSLAETIIKTNDLSERLKIHITLNWKCYGLKVIIVSKKYSNDALHVAITTVSNCPLIIR
ncbi:hypothetical protein BMS3Abin03_01783 [bacterium BMS3Abin03]|nr:hypothetical protein BMS3Abin03_01783 [bacterium BMS3Abin03]